MYCARGYATLYFRTLERYKSFLIIIIIIMVPHCRPESTNKIQMQLTVWQWSSFNLVTINQLIKEICIVPPTQSWMAAL